MTMGSRAFGAVAIAVAMAFAGLSSFAAEAAAGAAADQAAEAVSPRAPRRAQMTPEKRAEALKEALPQLSDVREELKRFEQPLKRRMQELADFEQTKDLAEVEDHILNLVQRQRFSQSCHTTHLLIYSQK